MSKPGKRFRLSLVTRWSALVGTLLAVGILIALALDHLLPGQPLAVLGIAFVVAAGIGAERSGARPGQVAAGSAPELTSNLSASRSPLLKAPSA